MNPSFQRIGSASKYKKCTGFVWRTRGKLLSMKGYGQYCPIAQAAEILTERWTPLVLRELLVRGTRFNDIRRGVPLMSPSLLSKRLQELVKAGLVERRVQSNGSVEYQLTQAGRELKPFIFQLREWGKRWLRRTLTHDQLDAGVLLWDIRGRVDPASFPPCRTVVQIEFTDLPAPQKRWWLVNEGDEVDLCLKDPGYEIDLYLVTTLRTLTEVWMGDVSLQRASEESKLEIHGREELRRRLRSWLRLSPFAGIRRQADHRISAASD